MKCIECKNWNLRKSSQEMRMAGWAPCDASDFSKSPFNGEKWNGTMERDSCPLNEFTKLDQLAIDARMKYLGVNNGN